MKQYIYLNLKPNGGYECHNERQCNKPHLKLVATMAREKKYTYLKKNLPMKIKA